MNEITLTSDLLISIAGVVLSLGFSYIPKLNTWYALLVEESKKLIMLGLLVLTTAVIFVLAKFDIIAVSGWVGNQSDIITFIWTLILAIISNQGIYKITPQTSAVKQAKDIILEDELYKAKMDM